MKKLLLLLFLLPTICFSQDISNDTTPLIADSTVVVYGELDESAFAYKALYGDTLIKLKAKTTLRIVEYCDEYFKVIIPNSEALAYVNANYFKPSKELDKIKNIYVKKVTSKNNNSNSSNYSSTSKKSSGGSVYVKGYYRKDGTYVRPHTRSRPRRR